MKNNNKEKLKKTQNISGGVNPKIVYHETGRIIANPFLKDDFSYYDRGPSHSSMHFKNNKDS